MIRRLFRRKINKVGAGISLILLLSMLVVFVRFMPEFVLSDAGRIFVGVWLILASLSFIGHGRSVRAKKYREFVPLWNIKKVERTTRVRSTFWERGL